MKLCDRIIGLFLLAEVALTAQTRVTYCQTQIMLEPIRDNTLYEHPTGDLSNGAGQYIFVGRTNQPSNSIRRALLAFDIAGNIPAGSTILTVTLTLTMSQTTSAAHTVTLHRATADWGEGTSMAAGNEGSGAPATTGDATWVHRFFNTAFWTSVGGDFVATPSASLTVDTVGTYTWGSTTGMVNDVQQWLNAPSTNFGWLMRGNEVTAPTSKRFGSRQNLNATARPKLTIQYQSPLGVHEGADVPRTFALHPNVPNPLSAAGGSAFGGHPFTTIAFDVAERRMVSLTVSDILGRVITTLVNEPLDPGTYTRRWNAAGAASGVYFVRLQAGSFSQTRKIVLAR